jgi:transcription elongation GreA/GreB family factor
MIKELLLQKIISLLDQRIELVRIAIESAKESRDNETKSSVGDKYETGRTLMQMEVEKNRIQLKKTENLKHELLQIETGKKSSVVEFGSIVKTTQNNYFISSALGKIEINNEIYYCISLASPIGKLLNTKQVGDQFPFQEKVNRINEVH